MNNILLPNVLAASISKIVVQNNPDFIDNKEEIRYGLEWIISGMNQIILVLIFAWPFNILAETIAALAAGALLRMFSGGAHFKKYSICLAFSTVQILIIGYISKNYYFEVVEHWPIILTILFGSFILTGIKSPFLQKKKHLFNSKRKKMQKKYAIAVFFSLTFICISLNSSVQLSVAMALIIQSVSLTATWEKGVNLFDAFLYKMPERRMKSD